MNIALFTSFLTTYETTQFAEAAVGLGYDLTIVPLSTLLITIGPLGKINIMVTKSVDSFHAKSVNANLGLKIAEAGDDLTQFDAVLIRGANKTGEPDLAKSKLLIAQYYEQLKIPVLNGSSLQIKADNKLWQHSQFLKHGISIVPTVFAQSSGALAEYLQTATFPLIIKESEGSHGAHVFLAHTAEEAQKIYAELKNPPFGLIQPQLQMNWDLRVLVLGGKVIGGMKRIAGKGSHTTNFSGGGTAEKIILTPEEEALALAGAKALNADYGGADLMRDARGTLYLLEFNRNAQFKGFEQTTGISVAIKILEFLTRK